MSRRDTTDSILKAFRSDLLALRERVTELTSEVVHLREEVSRLELENAALRRQKGATAADRASLEAKIAALGAELARRKGGGKNSSNSSKPPSTDHPHDPKSARDRRAGTPDQPGAGRKRGGQPGHPGAHRPLAPEEDVQHFMPCLPPECEHCHDALPSDPGPHDPAPRREQCWELPAIVWEISEYLLHCRTCRTCGQRTWGKRPPDAPRGGLGFRAQAWVGQLTGGAQLSRRAAHTLLAEGLGFPVSLGTLSTIEDTLQAALAPAYTEVAAAVASAPVVNCDETPWRAETGKPWLWTAATPTATLFQLAPRRDAEAFLNLGLTQPGQVKTTDRYTVYIHHVDPAEHQICWSHLDRDFLSWREHQSVAAGIAAWLSQETVRVFHHWHEFLDGASDRAGLADRLAPVQAKIQGALSWGAHSGVPKFQGFCCNLLERWESLWTFVIREGVEPTNNAGERALRQAVLWRKTSLFTQSERGQRYVERMLTVKTTLRKLGGNLLEFLTETLRCAQAGLPAPQLLPDGR
jgi:transposase